jgi:hypothetical protein
LQLIETAFQAENPAYTFPESISANRDENPVADELREQKLSLCVRPVNRNDPRVLVPFHLPNGTTTDPREMLRPGWLFPNPD